MKCNTKIDNILRLYVDITKIDNILRLYVDLSMEQTLYGGPYEWVLFAAMETVQLVCCFAVYPVFIVSG